MTREYMDCKRNDIAFCVYTTIIQNQDIILSAMTMMKSKYKMPPWVRMVEYASDIALNPSLRKSKRE